MHKLEVDIHGFELWDAIEEIIYCSEECKVRGIQENSIIHAYHSGQVLKNYIHSEGFLKEMAREGFRLKMKESSNIGISCFLIV